MDGSKIDREVPNWWSHKTIPQLIGHGKEKYEILNPTMPSENFADKYFLLGIPVYFNAKF